MSTDKAEEFFDALLPEIIDSCFYCDGDNRHAMKITGRAGHPGNSRYVILCTLCKNIQTWTESYVIHAHGITIP